MTEIISTTNLLESVMHSKINKYILSLLFIVACSSADTYSQRPIKPRIGNYVQSFHSSLNGGQHKSDYFAVAEQKQNSVQIFRKKPFEHVETIDIPGINLSRLLLSPDSSYGLAIGKASYAIVNKNREVIHEPVPIPGAINSVSYLADSHLIVIQGVYKSIILMQLDREGNLVASLAKGPNTDSHSEGESSLGSIISGVLLRDGHFIVGTDEGKLLDIDVIASITKQDWSFRQLDYVAEEPILFIDSIDEGADQPNFWVLTKKSLKIFEYKSESILDEMSVSGFRLVGLYSQQVPHLFLKQDDSANQSEKAHNAAKAKTTLYSLGIEDAENGEFANWYEKDGYTVVYQYEDKLRTKEVQLARKPVQGSFLDHDLEQLVVVHNEDLESQDIFEPISKYARQEIYRARFQDGLITEAKVIEGQVQLVLDGSRYFRIYHSELGYAESWRYGHDEPDEKLDLFNFRHKYLNKRP